MKAPATTRAEWVSTRNIILHAENKQFLWKNQHNYDRQSVSFWPAGKQFQLYQLEHTVPLYVVRLSARLHGRDMMHFSKPFFFYCPINTKRSLFSCDGYFKVLNVVSQKAVSPTCLVSESQKVEHFTLSRSFYSILILFRRQQILLVLWALRVWESVCLKRGSKASMESWMPPSPGLGHCPRWGDLKVSDAEKGGGGLLGIYREENEKTATTLLLHSLSRRPRLLAASHISEIASLTKFSHSYISSEWSGRCSVRKLKLKISTRERFGPGRLDKGVMGIYWTWIWTK